MYTGDGDNRESGDVIMEQSSGRFDADERRVDTDVPEAGLAIEVD